MKNIKAKLILGGILTAIFLVFFSCCTTDALSCPYLISNPRVVLGEKNENVESDDTDEQTVENYKFVGMHFSVFNDTKKIVKNFTVSFMLYDSDGNNPFIGSNCIVSKCEQEIPSEEVSDFVINLDSYISEVPNEPYVADFIYLREIKYDDGSVWRDPYGMYCVRESQE